MDEGKISSIEADKSPITFDSESTVFEEMKVVFNTVTSGIPDDSPYLAFKNRFSEAYNFFVSIYNKNQKLLQKAQEGNAEIIMNVNKISTIIKISQSDAKKLGKYKKEYTEAVDLIQTLHTAEEKSKELLQSLRSTITKLNGQVQRGEAFCYGEDDNIALIIQDVKNLKREKNETSNEISETVAQIKKEKEIIQSMNDQITILTNNSIELEKQMHDCQGQLNKINDEVENARSQINEVKPFVDNQKSKLQSNNNLIQEHETIHKNLTKENHEVGKQLLDNTSKLKQLRYQISQHIKQRNKLIRHSSTLEDRLEHVQLQHDQYVKEYDLLNKDLDTNLVSIQANSEILTNLSKEFDSIEEKKRETRIIAKNLRDKLTNLTHKEFMQDAEKNRTIRHIESANHGITTIEVQLDGEKIITANVNALNVDLTSEKRSTKKKMQEHKIKIRQYEQEIESKVYEKMQIERRRQLVEDEKEANVNKINEDNDTLDDLQSKLHQQDELMDVLRKERNNFKRKYLACEKEKVTLNKQIGDLQEELEELKEKNREILFTIADEHYTAKAIRQQLMSETIDVSELKEHVNHANESITSLQSQRQLMRHVLNDAAADRSLLLKEIDTASGSKKSIVGTLGERSQTIERLKGNILTLQRQVERGKNEFEKLCDRLAGLVSELNDTLDKNEVLEKKIERLKFTENDERRLFIGVNRETQKFAALIREISIPRNVHRWQMYSATDPQYQKNLVYLASIYSKLDKAHRYLIQLEKKRDFLKKEVEERKKKVIPNGEAERSSFQYHMNKYKRDIDEKDRLINEMLSEIKENRLSIKNMSNGVESIRSKCTERRISVSQLKSRKLASRNERRQEALMFMTEPDALLPLGGGFVQKLPSNVSTVGSNVNNTNGNVSANKVLLNDNQTFNDGKTPRKKLINHTPRTPKSQQQRIMRPQTAIRKKRPLTALQAIP